jgi:hypothetical protein
MATTIQGIKKLVSRNIKETEKDVELFARDFEKFLFRSLDEIIDSAEFNAEPIQVLGQFIELFRERGMNEILSRIGTLYGSELRHVQQILRETGINLDMQNVNLGTIEQLIRFRFEDIENRAIETIGSLRPIILESIVLGERPNLTDLKDRIETRLINYTKTELNTAIISFSRSVNIAQALDLGLDLFLYVGPDDDITRPFCEDLLAKDPPIYTLAEIEAMDNDQGLPVMTSGGGYNCRHSWQPLSLKRARRYGYGG